MDAGGEVVQAAAELVVAGERGSLVGEVGSLVLQFFSAGGDFCGAALHFGEFDEPALVEVDEAAPFGAGGVDFAVQPRQFGGEEFVVGYWGCRVTACSPASSTSRWVIAARMWSNTNVSRALQDGIGRRPTRPSFHG